MDKKSVIIIRLLDFYNAADKAYVLYDSINHSVDYRIKCKKYDNLRESAVDIFKKYNYNFDDYVSILCEIEKNGSSRLENLIPDYDDIEVLVMDFGIYPESDIVITINTNRIEYVNYDPNPAYDYFVKIISGRVKNFKFVCLNSEGLDFNDVYNIEFYDGHFRVYL